MICYLDHAASTPIAPAALDIWVRASRRFYANPAAQHRLGREAQSKLEEARQFLLAQLGADAQQYQLIFTSSATEANNLILSAPQLRHFDQVHVFAGDHASLVEPARQHLEDSQLKLTPSRTEHLEQLHRAQDDHLWVTTHVNSSSGQLTDPAALPLDTCWVHLDAAQSFAKLPLDLAQTPVHSLTLSAHKMGGPRGVGALVWRRDLPLAPQLFGGDHEMGLRASTPALALVLSWMAAVKDAKDKYAVQRAQLPLWLKELKQTLKSAGLVFPFATDEVSPFILTLITPGLASDVVLRALEEKGFIASASSACSSRTVAYSPVFQALGLPETQHKSVLRLSFGPDTTEDDLKTFGDVFCQTLQQLNTYKDSTCLKR